MSTERVPEPFEFEKQYTEEDQRILSLKFTSAPCSITNDTDTFTPRALMSCGHAVDPNALTAWCRSLLSGNKYKFYCPAIVEERSNLQCKKYWPYEEVRRLALFNETECMYFEAKMSEFAAQEYCDTKECPRCRSFVEREDLQNLRVKCLVCSEKNGSSYEFCWNCLKNWSGPSASEIKCGNPACEHPRMPDIRDAPFISLLEGKITNVPSRRACPQCGLISEHTGEACKMLQCPRCRHKFCFACLKAQWTCLETGSSHYGKCSKPVAPKQTSIPVWKR